MLRYGCLCLLWLPMACSTLTTPDHRAAPPVYPIAPISASEKGAQVRHIQEIFDKAEKKPAIFHFAPGDYRIDSADGLRIPGEATLIMENARFLLDASLDKDGQAFLIEDAAHITLIGGAVIGRRDSWPDAVNVAGVRIRGAAGDIRLRGMSFADLSSNAVGVFGKDAEHPIRGIYLDQVTAQRCCNRYTDYLQPNSGPAPGSLREDQGTVAFYFVDGWQVDRCRFEDSRSDGTHFCHSRNGQFSNSTVTGSQMGGYFLEDCENVTATGNLFRENGSRGVTIERNSAFCIMTGNIVEHSGREGLWMPDVRAITVSGNVFRENGRKDDKKRDCEVRMDDTEEYAMKTAALRIEGNIFQTSPHQTAAIFFGEGVAPCSLENNTFEGEAPVTAAE